jgi:hypothetical protein
MVLAVLNLLVLSTHRSIRCKDICDLHIAKDTDLPQDCRVAWTYPNMRVPHIHHKPPSYAHPRRFMTSGNWHETNVLLLQKLTWPAGLTVTHILIPILTKSNVSTWHNKANSVNNSHLATHESGKLVICSRFAFSLLLCIISANSRQRVDCHLSQRRGSHPDTVCGKDVAVTWYISVRNAPL